MRTDDVDGGVGETRVDAQASTTRVLPARSRRRTLTRFLTLGFGVFALLLAWSSPAMALRHQGHEFTKSFAKKGSGDGELTAPSGIAVNEASGDIYVADKGNSRIERFNHEGVFLEAWGWGVADGKAEFETCTSACQAGISGEGEAQFFEPGAIAVDNSTASGDPSAGDVYVVASPGTGSNNGIEKFSAAGVYKGRVTTAQVGSYGGVAVDASGNLWSYQTEEGGGLIEELTDAQPNVHVKSLHAEVPCAQPGFAVDASADAFFLAHQIESALPEGVGCTEKEPNPNFPAVIAKVEGLGSPLINALDVENSSAVAVDLSSGQESSGDVYVDNITSIAAFEQDGALIQHFGEADLKKGAGIAVDAKTHEIYAVDASKGVVDVFSLASNVGAPEIDSLSSQPLTPTSADLLAGIDPRGEATTYFFEYGASPCPGSCTRVPASPETLAAGFGDRHVTVPVEGLAPGTTYYFRAIAKNEHGEVASADEQLRTFTETVSPIGLLADGRQWELVSPTNKLGATVEPPGTGDEGIIGGLEQASEDGSAVTYDTNAPIEGAPEANRAPEGTQVLSTHTAGGWSSKEIITKHTKADGILGGFAQEYRSFSSDLTRALVEPWGLSGIQEPRLTSGEGASEELNLYLRHSATCPSEPSNCYEPLVSGANDTLGTPFGGQLEFAGASPDLSHVVFYSNVALTASAPEEGGMYEWSSGGPLKYVSSTSLTKALGSPDPEAQLGAEEHEAGGNARNAIAKNGERVFWSAPEEETPDRLYMRDTAREQTIQVNAPEAGVHKLKPEQELEANFARFQIATPDGSRVFFTDTVSLTSESELPVVHAGPADLYVCEVLESGGGPSCKLKDLTVDKNAGEFADVVGRVLGINEEGEEQGSYVYFVANGVLAPGAERGHCDTPTTTYPDALHSTCNLYVDHYNSENKEWESPKLVAVLSGQDTPDWNLNGVETSTYPFTSRISPNGRYAAFMSDRSLTGYNNADVNSGKPDEEAFLYDSGSTYTANSGTITCVSCNPNPAQAPRGVFDTEEAGEGDGLIVDPGAHLWSQSEGSGEVGRWLAGSLTGYTTAFHAQAPYQPRYLLNNGQTFFNSSDSLVPHSAETRPETAEGKNLNVGIMNVYEYEPHGVGSCTQSAGCVSLISGGASDHESAFVDASSSGNDVFFTTEEQLVPSSDHDANYDIYDARVCTGAIPACPPPPPPPPPPCSSEGTCREAAPGAPSFPTSAFSGPGNAGKHEVLPYGPNEAKPKLTNAQKLAKALKSCRTKYKHAKHKRASCERKARHQYAPKKKGKKK